MPISHFADKIGITRKAFKGKKARFFICEKKYIKMAETSVFSITGKNCLFLFFLPNKISKTKHYFGRQLPAKG